MIALEFSLGGDDTKKRVCLSEVVKASMLTGSRFRDHTSRAATYDKKPAVPGLVLSKAGCANLLQDG